jgi:hypothetical protein
MTRLVARILYWLADVCFWLARFFGVVSELLYDWRDAVRAAAWRDKGDE